MRFYDRLRGKRVPLCIFAVTRGARSATFDSFAQYLGDTRSYHVVFLMFPGHFMQSDQHLTRVLGRALRIGAYRGIVPGIRAESGTWAAEIEVGPSDPGCTTNRTGCRTSRARRGDQADSIHIRREKFCRDSSAGHLFRCSVVFRWRKFNGPPLNPLFLRLCSVVPLNMLI